jgi:hypothetical protein
MGKGRVGGESMKRLLLVGKSEGKRPLGRPRRVWMDNIDIDIDININIDLGKDNDH